MYTFAMDSKRPFVGHIANQWLSTCTKAKVQGVTSSGIFLQLDEYRIIFLTEDPDFGPLNIVLSQRIPGTWLTQDQLIITYAPDEIRLKHASGQLKITNYEIWHIPPAPSILITKDKQLKRLRICVSQINTIKGSNGFSPYLPPLMKPPLNQPGVEGVMEHILEIRKSLNVFDSESFLNHAKAISGYGRGLTPSGDDLICGILFVLNRWQFPNVPDRWIEEINSGLFQNAIEKTTSVSISLIYCATQGSADYRIQALADALVNETIPFERQAMQLARWGGSSGADIFAGILIVIQSIFNLLESETANAKT